VAELGQDSGVAGRTGCGGWPGNRNREALTLWASRHTQSGDCGACEAFRHQRDNINGGKIPVSGASVTPTARLRPLASLATGNGTLDTQLNTNTGPTLAIKHLTHRPSPYSPSNTCRPGLSPRPAHWPLTSTPFLPHAGIPHHRPTPLPCQCCRRGGRAAALRAPTRPCWAQA
jgi:hypothetical protein